MEGDGGDDAMRGTLSPPMLCGAEEFLVGLSPGYWSHIPLTIADVTNMKIVGGVNCMVRRSNNNDNDNTCNNSRMPIQFFPVSKCTLVGMIVFAEAKANNSLFYVLDDGTGFIDCLAWGQGEGSIYALPGLADSAAADDCSQGRMFRVGDRVRVVGRIDCVCVSETKQEMALDRNKSVELRDCVHEIHVNKIEKLTSTKGAGSTTNSNDLDWEANHWVKSIAATKPTAIGLNNREGLLHATNVLDWLGPKIGSDVEHRRNFPSADDTVGEWRVFGVSCKCDLSYKHTLLYCHCQAKTEPLDPNYIYRDNLLRVLLEMEQSHHFTLSQKTRPDSTKHKDATALDFRFQYRTISNHRQLCEVADQVASSTEYPNNLKSERLVVATFRALRQDGIIHLLDERTDSYLLISRKSVLEPYLKRSLGRKRQKGKRLPRYLQRVPYSRLQYVKRCGKVDSG